MQLSYNYRLESRLKFDGSTLSMPNSSAPILVRIARSHRSSWSPLGCVIAKINEFASARLGGKWWPSMETSYATVRPLVVGDEAWWLANLGALAASLQLRSGLRRLSLLFAASRSVYLVAPKAAPMPDITKSVDFTTSQQMHI